MAHTSVDAGHKPNLAGQTTSFVQALIGVSTSFFLLPSLRKLVFWTTWMQHRIPQLILAVLWSSFGHTKFVFLAIATDVREATTRNRITDGIFPENIGVRIIRCFFRSRLVDYPSSCQWPTVDSHYHWDPLSLAVPSTHIEALITTLATLGTLIEIRLATDLVSDVIFLTVLRCELEWWILNTELANHLLWYRSYWLIE